MSFVQQGRGPERGFWCKVRKTPKFAMLTIDDAWQTAFEMFCYDGRVLTPYGCATIRTYAIVNPRIEGHPNPWRFSPAVIMRHGHLRRINRPLFRPCGCWHLTRSTNHILPRPTSVPGVERQATSVLGEERRDEPVGQSKHKRMADGWCITHHADCAGSSSVQPEGTEIGPCFIIGDEDSNRLRMVCCGMNDHTFLILVTCVERIVERALAALHPEGDGKRASVRDEGSRPAASSELRSGEAT